MTRILDTVGYWLSCQTLKIEVDERVRGIQGGGMRKLRRFLLGPKGQTHCYHVVSRFAGRHIVFGESEREFFRTLLRRQLRFSGLRTLARCCLGNHFHLLLHNVSDTK
ncbi:MAG TPA: hypothetical protein VMN36_13250 [Verrucomicrobiales bacterium]|nr:hypothetical protein [Verrucomicrobiales bacterium]